MKRALGWVLFVLAVAAFLPVAAVSESAAQAPVTLKAVTAWTRAWIFNDMYLEWIKRVNERAAGRLKIEYLGGPEVYPAFEQWDPLKRGVIDAIVTAPAYVTGPLSEINATFFMFEHSDSVRAREIGLYERLDKISREKAGVSFLGTTMWLPFSVYLTKPIEKADLRGFKIRSTPTYEPVLKGLGAATVSLPPAEVIPALQTGVVDGFAWPAIYVVAPGFARYVKYKVMPWWWEAIDGLVFVNAKSYDALPADLKKLMVDTLKEIEREAKRYYQAKEAGEDEQLKRVGVKVIELPASEVAKVRRLHWENGTKMFLTGPSPKYGPELKELMSQFAPR
jgi:TRAP-type C4-dicarboxylate transport system substrate-binding protein